MFTPAQIEEYRRDGYTVYPDFLSKDNVAGLLTEIENICEGNTFANFDAAKMEMEPDQDPDGIAVRRIYEPCTHHGAFDAMATSDRLLDCLEGLIGPDILRHYSKINMKPAELGSVVEWHQDLSYYPLTNSDSVAVLFYLDDTMIENGCLKIIPGVHEDALMDHIHDGFFQGRITEAVDESLAVPVEGRAGTAVFMNAMTPHASAQNTSEKPRRTLIISYRAADAYPIFNGEGTVEIARYEKLVRGSKELTARFTFAEFPIPVWKEKFGSLYKLQEESRENAG